LNNYNFGRNAMDVWKSVCNFHVVKIHFHVWRKRFLFSWLPRIAKFLRYHGSVYLFLSLFPRASTTTGGVLGFVRARVYKALPIHLPRPLSHLSRHSACLLSVFSVYKKAQQNCIFIRHRKEKYHHIKWSYNHQKIIKKGN
jgi:hypothetical protein